MCPCTVIDEALITSPTPETDAYLNMMEGLMAERPLSHPADWYNESCRGTAAPRQPNYNWSTPLFHNLIARQPPLTDADAVLIDDLARSRCQSLLSVDVAELLKSAGTACEDEAQCFIVAEADGEDAAGAVLHSATFLPLGSGGLRDAPLSATAEVNVTVHTDSSVTLLSDAVVPHAFLIRI